jgi:polyisoprenyl-teichoic acid--peptidoglycan teichoic acid transferase
MASRQVGARAVTGRAPVPVAGLWRALGLTLASSVIWGVAHVWAGRRAVGFSLMALLGVLVFGSATAVLAFRENLKQVAVQHSFLNAMTVGILVLAVVWGAIVIRSYQVVRPTGLPAAMRVTSGALVVIVAMMVCTPLVYAANATYVLGDTLSTIFSGDKSGAKINAADPWKGRPRINILLLGGDGGADRTGIRTDSMTVASIDTKTGNTVLLSLPRSLQKFPVPPRMRSVWPYGYTGDAPNPQHPGSVGLLNELYIQGEQRHPELEPGFKRGQRGPHLVGDVIGYLLGLKIDYYVLVNLNGFKDIVNAMGGVTVHVEKRLPIGGEIVNGVQTRPPTGYLPAGTHHLNGSQALWYGRSRDADDDFHRMDRQKCLMKDIADQADPQKVITHFQKLANAAKSTISTNIPTALLPALVKLSGSVKHGADIHSLPFNPGKIAGFHVYEPELTVMRRATTKAIAASVQPSTAPATPTATPTKRTGTRAGGSKAGSSSDGTTSLKNICK